MHPVVDVLKLAEAFRRHRAAAGMSQDEVAKRTYMSQKKYSRIEGAQVGDPGFGDVIEIGRVFGFSPNAIAEVAGVWAPLRRERGQDERWTYILHFVQTASKEELDQFLQMAYGASLAARTLAEQGHRGEGRLRRENLGAAEPLPYVEPLWKTRPEHVF